MNEDVRIADALVDNAGDILYIQTQTWLTNYPNPAAGITREDIEEKTSQWIQEGDERIRSIIQAPGTHTWVAKNNGKVIGFIGVQKGDDFNKIDAVHVLPGYQGKGIGTKLITKALEWLGQDKPVMLDVVIYNEDAQRLYERFGFNKQDKLSDDVITLPGGKQIRKVLMVRD